MLNINIQKFQVMHTPLRQLLRALLVSGCLSVASLAGAEPILFAGSIYQVNNVAVVQGAGLNQGDSATVRVFTPDGQSTDSTVVVNAEGLIAVEVILSETGKYFAALVDSNGEIIATVSFMAT